jgi:hypothetical protein
MLHLMCVKHLLRIDIQKTGPYHIYVHCRQLSCLSEQLDTFPFHKLSIGELNKLASVSMDLQEKGGGFLAETELESILEKLDSEVWKRSPLDYPGRVM